jgi:hypothetical protein
MLVCLVKGIFSIAIAITVIVALVCRGSESISGRCLGIADFRCTHGFCMYYVLTAHGLGCSGECLRAAWPPKPIDGLIFGLSGTYECTNAPMYHVP